MKKECVILALRNLMRYRTRTLLTGVSIALGTAAIILGLAFTNGIIRQTIIGFTGTLIEDIMIFPSKGTILKAYGTIEASLVWISGIDYVTRKVQFWGVIFSDIASENTRVMGMEPEGIRRKTNLKMVKGRYLDSDDRLSLILSEKLASRLKVDVGDKVAIVVNMPEGGTNAKDFRIEGIFVSKTGLQFVDHLIYTSLRDTQDLMGLRIDQVYSLGVYLKDVDGVDRFEKVITERLGSDGIPCKVASWKKVIKGFLAQYYFIKYIVFIFTVVLLIIVCIGVVNAVFLSISERTREIGTMMAMGAKRRTIVYLFMAEGSILSLFATFFGSLAGVAICLIFEKIGFNAPSKGAVWLFGGEHLYPYLTVSTVMFSFCFVVAVTVFGMSFPILRASKMEPTEALGYV